MKGVILAGGTGSRLFPLTKVTNKHLLPVGREPMIYHPVRKLIEAGIDEILIVTGVDHMGDVVNLLGSGRSSAAGSPTRSRTRRAASPRRSASRRTSPARARSASSSATTSSRTASRPFVKRFEEQRRGARVLLKRVSDPQRFGVAEVKDGRIVGIEEKPKKPRSDLAVTGIYFYDAGVFDVIRKLRPSARGELEITDVNNAYIANGELLYDLFEGGGPTPARSSRSASPATS